MVAKVTVGADSLKVGDRIGTRIIKVKHQPKVSKITCKNATFSVSV